MRPSGALSLTSARDYLAGLETLHRLPTAEARRAAWRQALATLAQAAADRTPAPLEGLRSDALRVTVRVAIAEGLVDDLGFLSAPHGAVALYELAGALPASPEKRELGRRVLSRLSEGDAATFVALATSLALGARRALAGAPFRARVALSLDLPIGTGIRADALALALVSRRELVREWLVAPSTGALPARRLAARLLERAAREAALRAEDGDDGSLRVFESDDVRPAFERLLRDREPLVWRHVASARGLLSGKLVELDEQITRELRPHLSPTEWRRGAASLAARIAVAPKDALARANELLASEVPQRDAGLRAAMIFGLPRAAEAEPEATGELLELLVRKGGFEAAEALAELRRERVGGELSAWAVELARAQLREARQDTRGDDGRAALAEVLLEELTPEAERGALGLRERVAAAHLRFAEGSAREAFTEARHALAAVHATLDRLARSTEDTSEGRREVFRDMRDIDMALLENATLRDLLQLGGKDDAPASLDEVLVKLGDWLEAREATPAEGTQIPHLVFRLRRLRTLLHLVDAEWRTTDEDATRHRLRAARALLARAGLGKQSPMRRMLLAALARALDALVREEVLELSDVLLSVLCTVRSEDLAVIAEASMAPDLEAAVRGYLAIATAAAEEKKLVRGVPLVLELARALPPASAPRVEALRAALFRFGRALSEIAYAASLRELPATSETHALSRLGSAAQSLAHLATGARRRLDVSPTDEQPVCGSAIHLVDLAVERALDGRPGELPDALVAARASLEAELPPALAEIAATALEGITRLPVDAPNDRPRITTSQAPQGTGLPPWLPPSRVLGGFWVLRPLGGGGAGTVFVVRRADQKTDPAAELFALKVPEYDGAAARTLSEAEFLRVFREEAGALLALPAHPSLAGFVTFDAVARPKPLLVMELVSGQNLERRISQRAMDTSVGLRALDDLCAGLEAMHGAGLGHLDVKPSNIILRPVDGGVDQAVLVDFGLAGRKLRPGCATACYGAPEIWGLVPEGHTPTPMAADIYAFGAVAYEVLTGRTLFDATNEMAILTSHLSHDGEPEAVAAFARSGDAGLVAFASVLRKALRRDPRERATANELRTALKAAAPFLEPHSWPLQ